MAGQGPAEHGASSGVGGWMVVSGFDSRTLTLEAGRGTAGHGEAWRGEAWNTTEKCDRGRSLPHSMKGITT